MVRSQYLQKVFRSPEAVDDSNGLDWRYELVGDYLLQSHSYLAVLERARFGKSRYPLPADNEVVEGVFRDFEDLSEYRTGTWWQEKGIYLFGQRKSRSQITVHGTMAAKVDKVEVSWSGSQSLIVSIPLDLSYEQAIRQLRGSLKGHAFANAIREEIKPRYSLSANRLRSETLQLGAVALSLYRQRTSPPLWKMGHQLKLVPVMVFDLKEAQAEPNRFAYEKEVLATAARRLVSQSIWIAENAARGRFFTDKKFQSALYDSYKRQAGRPAKAKNKK